MNVLFAVGEWPSSNPKLRAIFEEVSPQIAKEEEIQPAMIFVDEIKICIYGETSAELRLTSNVLARDEVYEATEALLADLEEAIKEFFPAELAQKFLSRASCIQEMLKA